MSRCLIASMLIVSSLITGCQTVQKNDTATTQPEPPATPETTPSVVFTDNSEIYSEPQSLQNYPQPPDDLWELTRQHLQLTNEAQHDAVDIQIGWYSKYPGHMRRITENAARYYHYVLNEVLKRGLPAEIALLPAVESRYDPQAYSSGHAAGIWQFIPSTAKYRGIKRNSWYDGRKDIIDSTHFALDYLEHLNKRFKGDWLLTMAAYNAGGGTVSKAMRKNREAGKPTDFWSLKLPRETRLYVPRILAIASFVRSPDQYNMDVPAIENEPYFSVVKTEGQINLAQAASVSGIRLAELQQLNPGLLRKVSDPSGPHRLLVPEKQSQDLHAAMSELTSLSRSQWVEYKIKSGDSLSVIAEKFETPISMIKNANQLASNKLRAGKTLLIPQDATFTPSATPRKQKTRRTTSISQHKVKPGDTLWAIAQRYQTSVKELAQWNNLSSDSTLKVGQKFRIGALPASFSTDEALALQKIGYKVRSGDSLSVIADRYNINVADIREWNNLRSDSIIIKPGQQLKLFITDTRIVQN
ncbi:LysM peptidoglycan-binding domain-containing protein [Neptunomonas japonica]|uniref:LysM peptidoglycan-binding domain-containing protein n=1 Tax=Neptunomonas japonica TaxID=417574 RepID=UPI000405B7A1|nr:LysM peptidoglycan-binding domain-containing protein [Neptunomonas japonica]